MVSTCGRKLRNWNVLYYRVLNPIELRLLLLLKFLPDSTDSIRIPTSLNTTLRVPNCFFFTVLDIRLWSWTYFNLDFRLEICQAIVTVFQNFWVFRNWKFKKCTRTYMACSTCDPRWPHVTFLRNRFNISRRLTRYLVWLYWLDSDLIPRLLENFENWKKFYGHFLKRQKWRIQTIPCTPERGVDLWKKFWKKMIFKGSLPTLKF